jgi:hypothetical protein
MATNYVRPDATFPADSEFATVDDLSPAEMGAGWDTESQALPTAQEFNRRQQYTSLGMKYLCQKGIAEYDPNEGYQGIGMCIGSNGSVYWNRVACTGIDPVTDVTGAYWELLPIRVADAKALIAAFGDGRYLTQAAGDARYMLIGSGGISQAFADATYLRITDAAATYATMAWVGQQLAAYATTQAAQTMANTAQGNAIATSEAYTNQQLGPVNTTLANLQAEIDAINAKPGVSGTPTDVTGARAYNGIYMNANPYPIFVSVVGHVNNGGDVMFAYIGNASPPGMLCAGTSRLNAGGNSNYPFSVAFIVPPGWFYQVQVSGAGNTGPFTLLAWIEWQL